MKAKHGLLMSGAALVMAGCAPPHSRPHHHDGALRTITALDCPQSLGELTRKSASADGKTCGYADEGGGLITLQLISLSGIDLDKILVPIEADLRGEIPRPATPAGSASDKDKVDIDLPGVHIHAGGDGGASVKVNAGADQSGGQQHHSGVTVQANDSGAEVHVDESHDGVRRDFILTGDKAGPHGYRIVGYEVRGPNGGPLVMAVVKSKNDEGRNFHHDVRKLIERNIGG